LEGIGNTIGAFVKVADITRRGKYTSYARICVYMNIVEPLPEHIELEYHDSVLQQPLDYEHIPFRCRRCHEYGHLVRQCPLNKEEYYIKKQKNNIRKQREQRRQIKASNRLTEKRNQTEKEQECRYKQNHQALKARTSLKYYSITMKKKKTIWLRVKT